MITLFKIFAFLSPLLEGTSSPTISSGCIPDITTLHYGSYSTMDINEQGHLGLAFTGGDDSVNYMICFNPKSKCTNNVTTIIEEAGYCNFYGKCSSAFAFGTQGYARFIYSSKEVQERKLVICFDITCKNRVTQILGNGLDDSMWTVNGVRVDQNNNLVLAYDDKLETCLDDSCTNKVTTTLPYTPRFVKIKFIDNNPALAYVDSTGQLGLYRCQSSPCTTYEHFIVDTNGDSITNAEVDFIVDQTNQKIIISHLAVPYYLKVNVCHDLSCSNSTSLPIEQNTGYYCSISFWKGGYVVHGKGRWQHDLIQHKCNDLLCSDKERRVLDNSKQLTGYMTNTKVGSDDSLYVAYTYYPFGVTGGSESINLYSCRGLVQPSVAPSNKPILNSSAPTINPSLSTLAPSLKPTLFTRAPSLNPTYGTSSPTDHPTSFTLAPSLHPSKGTFLPTRNPSLPTLHPSLSASLHSLTFAPTAEPTYSRSYTTTSILYPSSSNPNQPGIFKNLFSNKKTNTILIALSSSILVVVISVSCCVSLFFFFKKKKNPVIEMEKIIKENR